MKVSHKVQTHGICDIMIFPLSPCTARICQGYKNTGNPWMVQPEGFAASPSRSAIRAMQFHQGTITEQVRVTARATRAEPMLLAVRHCTLLGSTNS